MAAVIADRKWRYCHPVCCTCILVTKLTGKFWEEGFPA